MGRQPIRPHLTSRAHWSHKRNRGPRCSFLKAPTLTPSKKLWKKILTFSWKMAWHLDLENFWKWKITKQCGGTKRESIGPKQHRISIALIEPLGVTVQLFWISSLYPLQISNCPNLGTCPNLPKFGQVNIFEPRTNLTKPTMGSHSPNQKSMDHRCSLLNPFTLTPSKLQLPKFGQPNIWAHWATRKRRHTRINNIRT